MDYDSTPVSEWKPDYSKSYGDLRGTPSHACVCGCEVLNIKAIFTEGEISFYFLDAECAKCGTKLTAPTPVDEEPNGKV